MDKYKDILTATLASFSALCEKEGLRWYMAFGSAIGTVRHKGLIPWDDDIDVYMPREDVVKLLALQAPDGYEILHYSKHPELPYAYVKYCDASTTVWEQQKYPCVTGVFIDVFPLDEVPSEKASAIRKAFIDKLIRYKRSIRRTTFKAWLHGNLHEKLAFFQDYFYYRRIKGRCYHQLQIADQALSSAGPGDKLMLGDNIYSDAKVTYDKALFDGVIYGEFEGMKVPLPSGNDALLKQIYGDYMTPPPPEARSSGHHQYFIDLDRRLSLAEIKKLQK